MDAFYSLIDTIQKNAETLTRYGKLLGVVILGVLFFSSLIRFLCGKKAQLNKAVSVALEIFCMYVLYAVMYALGLSWNLFPSPLPFVTMEGPQLLLFPILASDVTEVCGHILRLLIIAFAVNLLTDLIPQGKHVISWYFFRFVCILLTMGINFCVSVLSTVLLPPEVLQIAPTILLGCLLALILLGSLKLLVGVALIFIDPIIAALYTFFFASFIGRHLARALLSTALLTLLVFALDCLGITAVLLSTPVLILCIPMMLVVLALWYFVGHII